MNFGQVLTAMITPFDQDGALDLERTKKLVNHLLENGSDSLVVAGTTGESPTLSTVEKMRLFETVVNTVNGRVPVIAGTGTNDTNLSIQLTKEATALGVDGIMAVTPYYNKPSQKGMIEHFKAIANTTKLPIMLYNIPGRSVVNMTAETIIELSKVKNIVSVKEASGDLEQIAKIIEHTEDNFTVYSGDDSLTLPTMSVGADGVVSVAAHIIGNELQEMIRLFQSGNVRAAAHKHRALLPVMQGMFIAPNPTCVKAALQIKGLDTGVVRLPLVPLNAEEKSQLESVLNS